MDNPINPSTFNLVLEEYCNSPSLRKSRIRSDFKREIEIRNEYRGRELYELIQNADDEGASDLEIDLSDERVIVRNNGKKFTDDGVMAILRSNESKKDSIRLIGQKGLGFRSVLNWAKEVEIQSDGYSFKFSETIAAEKWDEIKKRFSSEKDEADDLESLARSKNRNCPIPVLSIPQMKQIDQSDWTSVIISFKDESTKKSIETQIESLKQGCVLLFLRTLCRVKIGTEYLSRGEKNKDDVVSLNDRNWIVLTHEGRKDECDENTWYQVSVAYPEDGFIPENNCLYCFFPTWEPNPFSCVIHATLRLGQSRNSLNIDEMNEFLMERCAELMYELAGRLKSSGDLGWKPLEVVYADCAVTGKYQRSLKENLVQKLLDSELFPTVVGGFVTGKEAHFISDELSNVVQGILGGEASCFSNMLIAPPREHYLEGIKEKKEWEYEEKEFVDQLNRLSDYMSRRDLPMDERARLIKAVVDGKPGGFGSEKPFLFIDENGQIIKDNGYLIASTNVPSIPPCVQMSLINNELYAALVDRFSIRSSANKDNPERLLCAQLENHFSVAYADKNVVVNRIVPNSRKLEPNEIKERVKALFDCLQGEGISLNENTAVFLLNEEGTPVESPLLVLHGNDIEDKWRLMPLQKWGFGEGVDKEKVDAFWRSLRVSDNVPMNRVNVVSDDGYLQVIGLTGSSGDKNPKNYKNKNQYDLILDEEFVNNYIEKNSLFSFICLLLQNERLFDSVLNPQQLKCTYYGESTPSFYPSYFAYRLERMEVIKKQFQGYVCSEQQLLINDNIPDYDTAMNAYPYLEKKGEEGYRTFLVRLGAASSLQNLTKKQLYDILKKVSEDERFKDGVGIAQVYEKIKQALSKKEDVTPPSDLKLFAKTADGKNARFYKYNEVYYWDNDRLPQWMVKDFPKLVIHGRAGVKVVHDVFGVNMISDFSHSIAIKDSDSIRFDDFEKQLLHYLAERKTFLDGLRNRSVSKPGNDLSGILNNDRIRCYRKCVCTYEKCDCYDLRENEIVTTVDGKNDTQIYHIMHSKDESIAAAFRNPAFCATILEVLAMHYELNVDSSDILSQIRNVLIYSMEEINYYYQDLIDESKMYLIADKCQMNGLARKVGFVELLKLRNECEKGFKYLLWKKLNEGQRDEQKNYRKLCMEFMSDEWLEFDTDNDNRGHLFLKHLNNRFHLGVSMIDDIRNLKTPVVLCKDYEKYCSKHSLETVYKHLIDPEIESLLFFAGNDIKVRHYLEGVSREERESTNISIASHRAEPGVAGWSGHIHGEDGYAEKTSGKKRQPKQEITDAQKAIAGEEAEVIALQELQNDSRYVNPKGVSETLDKVGGDDRLGYDIEYYEQGSDQVRYLEVKSMNGSSCILTKNEFKKGCECSEYYDLGFVCNKRLHILSKPFASAEYKSFIIPNEYVIYKESLLFSERDEKSSDAGNGDNQN